MDVERLEVEVLEMICVVAVRTAPLAPVNVYCFVTGESTISCWMVVLADN